MRDFTINPPWNKGKKTGPLPKSTCLKMGLATKKKWADGVYDSRSLVNLRKSFKDPVRNKKISDGLKGNKNSVGAIRKPITKTDHQRKLMSKEMYRRWNNEWSVRKATKPYRNTSDKRYVAWRTKVFKRDDYTCQGNHKKKKRGGYIEAHHIKPWAQYPKLRYIVKNGITLCKACHNKKHI